MARSVSRSETANVGAVFSAARDAFARAEFSLARRLLRAVTTTSRRERGEAALLDARASAALGDLERWFDSASIAVRDLEPGAPRTLALALRARVAKRLGKERDARANFEEAARSLARLPATGVALTHYILALDAFESLDFGAAEGHLRLNLSAGIEEAASLALLGWIDVKRERLHDAGTQFAHALRKAQASESSPNRHAEASALRGLLFVGTETADLRAIERARKAYAKMVWTEDLHHQHFAVVSELRGASLLEGNLSRAFFEAREAVGIATTPADRAVAEVNAAVVSRLLGDRTAAELQLGRAWNILRTERWNVRERGAQSAMAAFMIDGAAAMPSEARKAMTLFRTIAPKVGSGAVTSDRRALALEAMAAARIADAFGDEIGAERLYQKAFDLFVALGYATRSALVALDLRRITGDDAHGVAVREVLERTPDAWFGAQLAAQDGPIERLSTAELVVLAHLLRGDTAKAIGEKLERSPFTISNHTRKIFWAFEVNSRAKVIAICAELGVTPESIERLVR